MNREEWEPIKDYEGLYEVSNTGKVRSNNKELIQHLMGNYYSVSLCKNGKRKQYYVHRLVGQTFLSNPNNLRDINHKDENKLNNCVDNLEWCSHKYNMNYGIRNKTISHKNSNPRKNFKKVAQFDKQGNFIKEYENIYEAYKKTNKNMTHIKACCNGKRRMAGNYIWQYV